jgi:hypothetical protein
MDQAAVGVSAHTHHLLILGLLDTLLVPVDPVDPVVDRVDPVEDIYHLEALEPHCPEHQYMVEVAVEADIHH